MVHPAVLVLACVLSALAGGLVSRTLAEKPAPAEPLGREAEAMRGVERRLDRLTEALLERPLTAPALEPPPVAAGFEPDAADAPARPAAAPHPAGPAHQAAALSDDVFARELDSPPLPKMREDQLEAFFDETPANVWLDEAFRRRWMFTTERAALAHFGTPLAVYVDSGGAVRWQYRLLVRGRYRNLVLRFFRGRVIQMDVS